VVAFRGNAMRVNDAMKVMRQMTVMVPMRPGLRRCGCDKTHGKHQRGE
jgi:hypothetical protein